ncbi:hypothetical protein ABK040_010596 [Willaertia magna]
MSSTSTSFIDNANNVTTQSLQIFQPMFTMFGLTIIVWIYMYYRRITLFQKLKIDPNIVTPQKLSEISTPQVQNPSDNLKNLFEVPIIFYSFIFYLFITKKVNSFYLIGCWIFVLFRFLHSFIHCTFNRVTMRFTVYIVSTITLWIMIIVAFIDLFV